MPMDLGLPCKRCGTLCSVNPSYHRQSRLGGGLQGYLVHKNPPPPHRNPLGPYAYAYGRNLGGGRFLVSEVSL